MCDNVMNVVLRLMKLTVTIGLAPWSARRQPQTIRAGLLGMAPCARGRMRELCKATHAALKTVIRGWRDEYMISVCPPWREIIQRETLRSRPNHQYPRGPPSARLTDVCNGPGVVTYVFNDEGCAAQYDRWQWGDSNWQWYASNWNWSSSSSSPTWARPQQWWSQDWRQYEYDDQSLWY